MKYKILSLTYLFLTVQCVSVQDASEPKSVNILPSVIKPTEYSEALSGANQSDYKLREHRQGPVRIVPLMEKPEGNLLSDSVISTVKARFFRNFAINEVKIIHPDPGLTLKTDNIQEPANQKFFFENQVDGIVVFSLVPVGESPKTGNAPVKFKAVYRLIDPVSGTDISVMERSAMYHRNEGNSAGKLELYRAPDGFFFFNEIQFARMKTESLSTVTVRDFLNSSVTSEVDVYSSTPGVEITILSNEDKTVFRGRPPVTNLILDEGKYRIITQRHGMPQEEETLHLRAGRKEAVFLTWDDDPDHTNMSFYSIPQKQRVALDGVIQGETPFFRIAVMAGVYETEISQNNGSGKYKVNHSLPVEIIPGMKNDIVFFENFYQNYTKEIKPEDQSAFRAFWIPSSQDKELIPLFSKDGLRLKYSQSNKNPGLVSRNLLPKSFSWDVRLPARNASALRLGIVSNQDSFVVEKTKDSDFFAGLLPDQNAAPSKVHLTLKEGIKDEDDISLIFHYDQKNKTLKVTIGGREVFRGNFRNNGHIRLLMETDGSQPEPLIIKSSSIYSN